jgi:hypothetical protein
LSFERSQASLFCPSAKSSVYMTSIIQYWWNDTERVKPKCLGLKKVFRGDRPTPNRLSKAHINECIS